MRGALAASAALLLAALSIWKFWPSEARGFASGARADGFPPAQREAASLPPRIELGFDPESAREQVQPHVGPPVFPAQVFDQKRFEGTGRVSGRLVLASHLVLPRKWTLVLEPSRVLQGGDVPFTNIRFDEFSTFVIHKLGMIRCSAFLLWYF